MPIRRMPESGKDRSKETLRGAQAQGGCCRVPKSRLIKKFRNIIRFIVGFILGGYLLLLFGLNTERVQRYAAGIASSLLQEKLQTDVGIGKVEFGLFNRLTLRDVNIKDQGGRQMLEASMLSAKIEVLPLLSKEISLRTVSLLDGKIHLYKKNSSSAPNFQFVLDAFRSKEKKEPSRLNLRINSIVLRRCQVVWDKKDAPSTPGVFNPAHIHLSDIDANVSLKHLDPDSLNLRIRSFSVNEESGIAVSKLSMRLEANRKNFRVRQFELSMPHGTHLSKDEMSASYVFGENGKLFWKTLVLDGSLVDARLATDDAVPVVPQLKGLHRIAHVSADFRIMPEHIALRRLSVKDNTGDLALSASATLSRRNGQVEDIRAMVRRLSVGNGLIVPVFTRVAKKEPPAILLAMGDLDFKGNLHYNTRGESRVEGVLNTAVAHVEPDLRWKGKEIKGRLDFHHCALAKLFPKKGVPENARFVVEGRADLTDKEAPDVAANLRIDEVALPSYQLHGIEALCKWSGQRISMQLSATDPACNMEGTVSGNFNGHHFSDLTARMDIRSFIPATLGLTKRFGGARFSSRLEAEMADFNIKDPECSLRLTDFGMKAAANSFDLQYFNFSAEPSPQGTRLKLDSDFATMEAVGPLSYPKIKDCGLKWIDSCLPGAVSEPKNVAGEEEWQLTVRLRDAKPLQALLGIPLELSGPLSLDGNLRSDGGRSAVVAQCNGLKYNDVAINDLRLYLQGEHGRLSLLAQARKNIARADVKLELDALAENGRLQTDLAWNDSKSHKNSGTLSASTEISRANGKPQIRTTMIPSSLSINDSVWNVADGVFVWRDQALSIDRFHLSHAAQSLRLDGRLSNKGSDSIIARLTQMEVSFLLDLINFDDVQFAGRADGTVSLSSSQSNPSIEARLSIPDFRLNGAAMGQAAIEGGWNNTEKRIELRADMRDGNDIRTTVDGYVSPAQKKLDLHIGSRRTNIAFLRKYISGIFGDFGGRVSGHCRLFGPFKQLDLEGREEGEVSARLLATGARYKLHGGYIDIAPGYFNFNGMQISDEHQGKGTVSGYLAHTHLKNLSYSFRLGADNLLVYDRPKEVDMPFYATVFGTGTMDLSGKPGQFNADINLQPDKKTVFVYTINTPDTFSDIQMLTFGDAAEKTDTTQEKSHTTDSIMPGSTTDIRLNFTIGMNPAATMKIIMDEKAGDYITVHGSGPIRASYYNKGSFNMYGTYTVAQGTYKMSIQDVIRKDFELQNGGRIVFSGDPYDGDLDLKAVYAVNSASLSDLNIGNNLSQSSVRVNCILNFKGKVNNPEVSFDLDLPTVNEDEKQMVRNLINTEEEMNMQILYLLGVGRFYTYNYNNTEAASVQSQSSVAMKSFLSNTLSSQLNDIISNAIGSSDWTFGANLSTGSEGWSDMDVEGLLSGRLLNNRLLINGKFGYRDRPTYNSTNFIGDFDIQYLLTPNGGVSLKAYNETNDRYFTKSSLTTQGIGVMLKRDFSNLKELFTPNRKRKKKNVTVGSDLR